jgi:hypothetical protein
VLELEREAAPTGGGRGSPEPADSEPPALMGPPRARSQPPSARARHAEPAGSDPVPAGDVGMALGLGVDGMHVDGVHAASISQRQTPK